MPGLHHLFFHFRRYGKTHQPLYLLGMMIFFWTVFDGIMSYMAPIVITQAGFSNTLMGIILGSSSIAGALFDFILSKQLRSVHYRRLYLIMFGLCSLFPLLMWQGKTIWIYLLAMATWGFYYDLSNFGAFNFVSRTSERGEHASSFGVIDVFKSLGYLIAPIVAGLALGKIMDGKPFITAWTFLALAFISFVILIFLTRSKSHTLVKVPQSQNINVLKEIKAWYQVGLRIFPVLVVITLLNLIDSFYWSIGPLFSESLKQLHPFGGLFITLYFLPGLFIGWFVGSVTQKVGKKRTAFLSLLFGSLSMVLFGYVSQPVFILLIVMISASLSALAWPAIRGICADFITSRPAQEKEIEALADFATNIGYIIGPMLAGFLADQFDPARAFALLGVWIAFVVLVLFLLTPRKVLLPVAIIK